MAEALSATEIEDVLSSIRRLVAQDLKPADRAKLAAVVDISQKLVLSPESRIEDPTPDPAAKFVTVRRPSRRAAFPAIDEVLTRVDGQQPLPARDTLAHDQAEAADFTLSPEARLSDVAPEEFGLVQPSAAQNLDWSEEPENIDDLPPDDPPEPAFQGTIEPDAAWADAAEARVIAELSGESYDPPPEPAFAEPNFTRTAHIEPEPMMDEAALRALVQAIFREEMAGPMGERITRNIRKLVRAEVGRMLAAQELE